MNSPEIVVGVDGSAASKAAVEWAALEAVRRGTALLVVHAWDWRVVGAIAPVAGGWADSTRAIAEAVVSEAVDHARATAPDLNIRGEALLGAAGPTLIAASRAAELVVLGSRGRGGFASMLLGSVSQHVATHAVGSVAVVRGRAGAEGPVVVGMDGSAEAQHAVGVAFAEAAAREATLVAVRTYIPFGAPYGTNKPPYVEDRALRRVAEVEALDQDLAPWIEKYPNVTVETVVAEGHAGEALVTASRQAQLVVVGTRGHGGFAGLLLGSVGLNLLHHSDAPVYIARDPQAS
jgi:nucleotide-binding universal stress UspA family protein